MVLSGLCAPAARQGTVPAAGHGQVLPTLGTQSTWEIGLFRKVFFWGLRRDAESGTVAPTCYSPVTPGGCAGHTRPARTPPPGTRAGGPRRHLWASGLELLCETSLTFTPYEAWPHHGRSSWEHGGLFSLEVSLDPGESGAPRAGVPDARQPSAPRGARSLHADGWEGREWNTQQQMLVSGPFFLTEGEQRRTHVPC